MKKGGDDRRLARLEHQQSVTADRLEAIAQVVDAHERRLAKSERRLTKLERVDPPDSES